ncbi:hypothetical protein N665_0025s0171 [Sinapis alba]|nr:hypothetical protein N665_0025s0171 [Sinapis alba]
MKQYILQCWSERTKKSFRCRIQTIEKATKKLHVCIKQCENIRPSGASNNNIFQQAKLMFKFKDGDISARKVSNSCGFGDTNSELENPTYDPTTQESPSLSLFSLNLNTKEDTIGGSLSKRPMRVKNSNLKEKMMIKHHLSKEQQAQQPLQTPSSFGQYFNDINRSTSDLPYY